MNTETMKQLGDAMKGMSDFVNRQTAMNKTLSDAVLVLQKKVKELTERLEEDNE
tara:strand:- start:226 stop:387 length:162 start_codon:yes stop_codon:yes gene_type:complete